MKYFILSMLMMNIAMASGQKHCHPDYKFICVNDEVIADDGLLGSTGKVGKVLAIYQNNEVDIEFSGESTTDRVALANIADVKDRLDYTGHYLSNTPGLEVISDTGIFGEIVGNFSNGDLEIKFLGIKDTHRWPKNRLAERNDCTTEGKRICEGDFVKNQNNEEGKVVGVFENSSNVMIQYFGKVAKHENKISKMYKVNADELNITQSCSENPLCKS